MKVRDLSRAFVSQAGFLTLWPILTLVWVAVTSSFDLASVIAGATVSAALAYFFAERLAVWRTIRMSPLQLYHFVLYTGVFFRELVEANIAVMRYVYAPRIRIRPGILRARTRLRSPIGRLALANSVTLTPGSLVLDTDEDALVVHCLDLTDADREKVAEAIVRPVEKHLERVFG
jgi:multicomponent Na+:H+ antiporter subunit E